MDNTMKYGDPKSDLIEFSFRTKFDNFVVLNAIKYVIRYGKKDSELLELDKAIDYLERYYEYHIKECVHIKKYTVEQSEIDALINNSNLRHAWQLELVQELLFQSRYRKGVYLAVVQKQINELKKVRDKFVLS